MAKKPNSAKKEIPSDLYRKESDVQSEIIVYLRSRGHFCFKFNNASVRGRKAPLKGVSDLLCVMYPSGRFVALEVKKPKGSHEYPEQKEFIKNVIDAGGIAAFVHSVEEVIALGL